MKKKFLFGISAIACVLAVGAFAGVRNSVRSDAAVIKDVASAYEDNFSSLDEKNWSLLGEGAKDVFKEVSESVVDTPSVHLEGYQCNSGNSGYFRTENPIRLHPGYSLRVYIEGDNWNPSGGVGALFFQGLRNTDVELAVFDRGIGVAEGGDCANDFAGGSTVATRWSGMAHTAFNGKGEFVFQVNPDGSGSLALIDIDSGDTVGSTTATGLLYNDFGYFGIQGLNGLSIDITRVVIQEIDSFKNAHTLFKSCLVPGHANMGPHGNEQWGSHITTFKNINVQSTGKVHVEGFNYNDGNYVNDDPICIGSGKTFVYEVDVENWEGILGISTLSANKYQWPNFIQINPTSGYNVAASNIGGSTLVFPGSGSWHNITNPNSTLRLAINSDGTGKFGLIEEGVWSATASTVADLTGFPYANDGYIGIYGNGGTLKADIVGIRIGEADDADGTNLVFTTNEDFRYARPCNFHEYENTKGAQSSVEVTLPVLGRDVHEVHMVNPNQNVGLFFTGRSIPEGTGKLAEVNFAFTPKAMGQGGFTFGIAVGAGLDGNAANAAVILSMDGTDYYLGTEAIPALEVDKQVVVNIEINVATTKVSIGDVSYESANACTPTGGLGFAAMTENAGWDLKFDKLTFTPYKSYDIKSRNINVANFDETNMDWFYKVEDNDGSIKPTADGAVEFKGADGCAFGTKLAYANWSLETTFEYFYDEEEETIVSTWAGIVFGKDVEYTGCAWAGDIKAPMAYFSNAVVDFENIPGAGRGWTSLENNPMQQGENYVKLTCKDGHLELYLEHEDATGATVLSVDNFDAMGRIAFTSTVGAHYFIKSFKVTNLDYPDDLFPEDKTTAKSVSVNQGETVNGKIVGNSAYGDAIEYNVKDITELEGKGTLTLNDDGSWNFAANEDAALGTYKFSYEIIDQNLVTDGEISIEIKEMVFPAPTKGGDVEVDLYTLSGDVNIKVNTQGVLINEIKVDGKAIGGENYDLATDTTVVLKQKYVKTLAVGDHTVEVTTEGGSVSMKLTVKDTTPTPTPTPEKKGCGSSIIAASAVVSLVAIAGAALVLGKKKED